MTAKLKQLNETVGALKKEIRTYLDSEDRKKLTPEQRSADPKLAELENKYASAAADFDAEFRQAARESGKPVELSRSEQRAVDAFDIGRALRGKYGIGSESLDGVERELTQEGFNEARAAGIQDVGTGILLPRAVCRRQDLRSFRGSMSMREQRDMTATGTTSTTGDQGGQLIATTPVGLLDSFYNADVLESLGITTYDGLVGNITLPRYVRPTAPTHKTETANADELSPTLASLSLSPNRLPAFVDITDQLLIQGPGILLPFLNNSVIRELRSVMQINLLHGTGGSNTPVGVAATSGIAAVYAGGASSNGTNANGAAPVWADMVNLETGVANANADEGRLGYLFNSKLRGKLKQTLRASSTDSMMIWDDRAGGLVNGYRPTVTNAVSSTLTKGASSGILSGGFFGNWIDLVRAIWGGMAMELVSDSTNRIAGSRRLVASVFYSGGVQRPASFAYCADFDTR